MVPVSWLTSAANAMASDESALLSVRAIVPLTVPLADADTGTSWTVKPDVGPPTITGTGSRLWSVRVSSTTLA